MENKIYGIRKLIAISFGIDVFLLCVLFVLSFLVGGSSPERIVLAVFLIPSLYVLCELWSRRVVLDARGVRLEKFLRKKELGWHEITNVGALVLRSRTYLLLTTAKGFVSISNSYENFSHLIQDIAERVDEEKIEEEVRRQIDSPQVNSSELIKFWIAALVMLALIIIKLFF
jgi:hypothetical protein